MASGGKWRARASFRTQALTFLLVLLACHPGEVVSQDIRAFFLELPGQHMNDLSLDAREELLSVGRFYPAGDTGPEVVVYHARVEHERFMTVDMTFESDHTGFNLFELKAWPRSEGGSLYGVSRIAGSRWIFDQADLSFFTMEAGQLRPENVDVPERLELRDFAEPGTPDSVMGLFSSYVISVHLDPEESDLLWVLATPDGRYPDWLRGNAIRYRWNGTDFDEGEMTETRPR